MGSDDVSRCGDASPIEKCDTGYGVAKRGGRGPLHPALSRAIQEDGPCLVPLHLCSAQKGQKVELPGAAESELRDDDEFPQLESGGDYGFAESSQVVLVGVADLFDEAVNAEALEQSRHLPTVFLGEVAAQGFILHAADVELATCYGAEQGFIVGVEQIEAGVGSAFVLDRLRELVELVASVAGIFDGGQELQVAPVGGSQNFPQGGQAIDGLLHRRPLGFFGAVGVFYLAVVLEKGQICPLSDYAPSLHLAWHDCALGRQLSS